MTDGQGAKVFDMPHARVTLTPVGPNVEIEVWPKRGQSAYAVVDPRVAILIARHLVELATVQLAAAQRAAEGSGEEDATDEADRAAGPPADGSTIEEPNEPTSAVPDNVVDFASRRAGGPRDGGRAG